MENLWSGLLKQQTAEEVQRSTAVVVICAESTELLQQFEARYLPSGSKLINKTMQLLGFTSVAVNIKTSNEITQRALDLDVYAIRFPISDISVEYLKAFRPDCGYDTVSWFFLLDWSMPTQSLWLGQLNSAVDTLTKYGVPLSKGSVNVCCMNTDHIYTWQKNSTKWLPSHVDFVQQSIRSFCLLKQCSLIYCRSLLSSEATDSDKEVFINLLTKKFKNITKDSATSSSLVIPYGSDTVELIKSVCPTFEPAHVVDQNFIEKYEEIVPNVMEHVSQAQPNTEVDKADSDVGKEDISIPYRFDIQLELSKLYRETQLSRPNTGVEPRST